jgi:hypothetical protein
LGNRGRFRQKPIVDALEQGKPASTSKVLGDGLRLATGQDDARASVIGETAGAEFPVGEASYHWHEW